MEQNDSNITNYSKRSLAGLGGIGGSYHTIWSCKPVNKDDPRGLVLNEVPDACFSRGQSAYCKLRSPHKHTLRLLTIPGDNESDPRTKNLTLLSPDQIVEMLMLCNQMKEGLISEVSMEENIPYSHDIKRNSHLLSFTINTDINLIQKFILSWMRYAWETPYNTAISDAFKLREHIDDKSLTLFDWYLVCIYALTYLNNRTGYNAGHAITFIGTKIAHFTSPSDLYSSILKNHTESLDKSRAQVNKIYKYSDFERSIDLHPIPKELTVDNEFTWKDEEMFNKRLPYYLKWYEYIKSLA